MYVSMLPLRAYKQKAVSQVNSHLFTFSNSEAGKAILGKESRLLSLMIDDRRYNQNQPKALVYILYTSQSI